MTIREKLLELARDYDHFGSLLAYARESGVPDNEAYAAVDEAIKAKLIEVRIDHLLGSLHRKSEDLYLSDSDEIRRAVSAGELYLWFEPCSSGKRNS